MSATAGIPPPGVTEETRAFWDAAAEGRLVVERCAACGAYGFPARGICRSCRGRAMEPPEVTGRGEVEVGFEPGPGGYSIPSFTAVTTS